MLKISINHFLIFAFALFISCNQHENGMKVEKEELEKGYIYHFIRGDSVVADVGFTESGNLKYILNFPVDYDQVILFYEETGVLQSKLKKDRQSLETFGRTYYFHEHSGYLSSDFNFVDGVKTGSAVSYHDSTDRIKSVMMYNDKGELYYRKTFDKYGNHIKTEGSKN